MQLNLVDIALLEASPLTSDASAYLKALSCNRSLINVSDPSLEIPFTRLEYSIALKSTHVRQVKSYHLFQTHSHLYLHTSPSSHLPTAKDRTHYPYT